MTQVDVLLLARKAGIPVGICAGNPSSNQILEFAKLVAEHEREQCAKVCETNHHTVKRSLDSFECARAIRARGEV